MERVKGYNKGFTLVELLAVIVIIGILLAVSVTAVIHFIDRAKVEQRKNQEKTMAMAAENYLQENRGQLPKNIGETTTIPISVLKNNKYITEDIKDGNGKSCMVNSYVTVYKESKTKYVYKGHLYCGDEEVPATVEKAKPTIKIDFVDAEGNSIKNDSSVLEKVAEARFIIEFGGGKKDDKKIAIDGYSYSVLARVQGESSLKEVYSSGTLSANHATEITVNRDNNLKDYIDISKETTVAIKATVRNVDGGINDKVEFIGESGGQAEVVYHDTKAPTCVTDQTKGEASENDWININSSNKERKITVVCKDGGGSGCIRSTFTKTWLNNESHEFDNITIKDNAGNTKNCKVRVNIDVGYPIINIDAFAVNNTDPSNSILTGSKTTENSPNGIARINSGEYRNLVNGYMGNSKYPNGVIYKVTLKDNISLKNWKWEVNNKGIKTTTASNYETIGNIEEAKSGSCLDKNECSFNITFKNDGLRKGKLTVYDKAGNKAEYTIYANIDREGPTAPTIINSSTGNSTGKWVKNNVTLNLKSTDSLSGIGDYYYTYKSDATAFGSDATKQWVKLAGGSGKNNFTTMPWTDEMNKKVYVKACDVVGNCSSSSNTKIMIDKTAPTGMRVVGYKKNSNVNITSATGLSTIGSDTWHKGWEIVVADNATDNSGVGEVYYKVTVTGASTNVTDEVKSYKNVNAEGISIISFKSCDKLGNCSTATSFRAKLDRTPPTQTSINNSTGGNWTKDSVTLTIGSSDSLSGMGEYYYTYNASANTYGPNEAIQWVNLAGGSEKTSFTPAAWTTEKNQQVYIESCDKVGNCSEKSSTWIRIDKTAPTVPEIINPTGGNWTSGNITLTFNSSDSLSGLKNYQYTYSGDTSVVGDNADNQWVVAAGGNNANSVNNEFAAERNQLVYVRACDNVDNCSDKSSTYIRIDKSNPTCSVTKTETERQSGVTVRITCSDSGSGCATGTRTKTITSDQTYYVSDNVGHTGSCSVSVTSYSQCGACLRNTVYSAVGCYAMSGNVHHWTSCATPSCGKTSVCKNEQYSSAMGCCYYNCNCKTYYK